jgi:predicted transcriptional regulator of viral defense system
MFWEAGVAMPSGFAKKVLEIARNNNILRPRDLDAYGIPRKYLGILHQKGFLSRVGHGLYVLEDADLTEKHTIAEVCKRVPRGVVCLLSALQFHDLTTQAPFQVWLAIDRKAWLPKEPRLPIRIVRFSGPALEKGIEEHIIEGVPVKIYNPAKTVADCFKYRNKIGLDVALEALRDCRRERKCTNYDLWEYAKICRVANVMKPYLEATA